MENLDERVKKFNLNQLPGQPMGMHMGTMYLVNDLWREVQRLREFTKAPDFLGEALNSGDGTYKP